MTINEIKNLNKKSFIHYKTGKKTELLEATGLKIVIENENKYFRNTLTNQLHFIYSLEQAEKIIKENIKSNFGEYIEIEDREFYKENVGVKALYRNALIVMKKP